MVGKTSKKKPRQGMDEYGRTPLHYASEEAEVEFLLASGLNVNHQDDNGWTPLHFASQKGALEAAELFLDSGADVEAIDLNGNTPLWVAAMNSNTNPEMVKALIRHGADPARKNHYDVSPYDIAPELFDQKN